MHEAMYVLTYACMHVIMYVCVDSYTLGERAQMCTVYTYRHTYKHFDSGVSGCTLPATGT